MSTFARVLFPDPFGPMRAWISPLFTVSESPLRIGLPSTATLRLRISKVGVALIGSFRSSRDLRFQIVKLSPQPQDFFTRGFLNWMPAPRRPRS